MSIQAVAWAIDQKTGSAAGKVVLICLANYADEDGKCWPSQATIAAETELSERSVREWLQKLEEAGFVSREPRRRDDGYRASDLIRLAFKIQPAKSAGKANSHRQIAPILPEPVAAPTTFEPSVEPSSSKTDGEKGGASEAISLQRRLVDAVDGKIQPHAALVIGEFYELMNCGVDLETDILPTLQAVASKMNTVAGTWSYFIKPIKEAHNRRIEAGRGLAKPKPSNVIVGQWEQHLSPDQQRAKWVKTLSFARGPAIWKSWLWGPPPGREGCRIPADLIDPHDQKIDWTEEKSPEAA